MVVSERDHHHELICKGALEEVLAVCTRSRVGDTSAAGGVQDVALDATLLAGIQQVTRGLNEEGLRVVAVAMKEMPPSQQSYSVADETELTLIGYIAFLYPPKDSAAPALKALAAHGIRVKVLTGDNPLVTVRVCREVGLPASAVLLGAQVELMDDAALAQAAGQHDIFA